MPTLWAVLFALYDAVRLVRATSHYHHQRGDPRVAVSDLWARSKPPADDRVPYGGTLQCDCPWRHILWRHRDDMLRAWPTRESLVGCRLDGWNEYR